MTNVASLAGTAALIGDPARAAMLVTLMDGRALTAGELAGAAGVTAPTASGHLGRMLHAGLLALEQQGRHRYYRIASTSVAGLIESLMSVTGELGAASIRCKPVRTGPRDRALRRARLCYDHLAGEVAVGIATKMVERGQLDFNQDGGVLSKEGRDLLASVGVHLEASAPRRSRQPMLCRPCLDWSERRPHLAGVVGRALYEALLREGWIAAPGEGRAVTVTSLGERNFERYFGLALR
jgi:DNA-binding transcriptional ArsR family regulator